MSKFDEVIVKAKEQLTTLGYNEIDEELLRKIARGLGPSIYKADPSYVSCSDSEELERLKNSSFTKKNFDLPDEKLSEAIKKACEKMKPLRNKMRVVFYYVMMNG